MNQKIVSECLNQSIKNLQENIGEFGLNAAASRDLESRSKNYTSLFPRDIGVSAIGILASDNKELIKGLKLSLETLVNAQSELGQFPFYYQPEKKFIRWWNPGVIDSTLWWAIAFLLYYQKTNDTVFFEKYKNALEKAFVWLTYQDTNHDMLLEQGEASDWADEMPRQGIVLYSNTLWYWLITLRIEVEGKKELSHLKSKVYEAFNTILWIHKMKDNNVDYMPDNEYIREHTFSKGIIEYTNAQAVYLPYYLGFVSHKSYEMRCDVLGNILACFVGLADKEKSNRITDFILRSGINLPYPVKALYPPIYPGEQDWVNYMSKGRQNYPWQYHNGGIWPFIGGFWVMWLTQYDKNLAREELEKLALANQLNDGEFNEYLHGQLGTPMGIPYQSWNMGMFIAAYHAVENTVK
jgi:glycogen debranching enzyme